MNPSDLIDIAKLLASGRGRRGRPRQTDLCRAVSASYYAQFHALARCCADMLAGATRARRSQPAWEQTYRALEHGRAKNQCENHAVMNLFPTAIRDFGDHFVDMQRYRHQADYAPVTDFERSWVAYVVAQTEQVIAQFNRSPAGDRRAFAIHILFRTRRQ